MVWPERRERKPGSGFEVFPRVDGREVHIGYDKEQELWCAAWEDDGTYYYAEAGEMEEKDFLKELKKIWNSL